MLHVLDLIEKVTYGSHLASLLKLEGIRKRTIQKLTQAAYVYFDDLNQTSISDLVSSGIDNKKDSKILRKANKSNR